MLFAVDSDAGKIICLCQVPQVNVLERTLFCKMIEGSLEIFNQIYFKTKDFLVVKEIIIWICNDTLNWTKIKTLTHKGFLFQIIAVLLNFKFIKGSWKNNQFTHKKY